MPRGRKRGPGILSMVATGIGYALVGTLGLPVVLIGGSIQLLSTGLSRLFCPNDDGRTNGSKHKFQGMRKGVKIYPS